MSNPIYQFQYLDKVDWYMLSGNPNAIPILEKNLDKVNWGWLCVNPNAHLLETTSLAERMSWLCQSKNEASRLNFLRNKAG